MHIIILFIVLAIPVLLHWAIAYGGCQQFTNCNSFGTIVDDLKLAMIAEAKDWKLLYGRNMNSTYSQLMEKIMDQIDDLSKRLSRKIKDLDDVRQAMAALKELRENEIFIDFSLGPIEVRDRSSKQFST